MLLEEFACKESYSLALGETGNILGDRRWLLRKIEQYGKSQDALGNSDLKVSEKLASGNTAFVTTGKKPVIF